MSNSGLELVCSRRAFGAIALLVASGLTACASSGTDEHEDASVSASTSATDDTSSSEDASSSEPVVPASPTAAELRAGLDLAETYYPDLQHGDKGFAYQSYIVLHDTEGDSTPENTLDWWEGNGNFVAAHFIVARDGHILQCVPLDRIAHHAGHGDTGNNEKYGVVEDGRDDMIGSSPIGEWAQDYGMNAWSVGIEMTHVGGSEDYPEEQLTALDGLIAYIDAYFAEEGKQDESVIIDHKAWRTGNSDTSAEFAEYLANYQDHRSHLAAVTG